jgi:hypothetical protein
MLTGTLQSICAQKKEDDLLKGQGQVRTRNAKVYVHTPVSV